MRVASLILAMYIGFLTGQPMTAYVDQCFSQKIETKTAHGCCEKKAETQSEKKGSCETQCPGFCNPFGQGTCCFYTPTATSYNFALIASTADFNTLTTANLSSNYLADCFHPPELV